MSVVVPALNEARNLPRVLRALPADIFEVVLVDGGSVDGTVEVARRLLPDVRVVPQTRRGKGNALACGLAAARGDIIVTLDADGSADPQDIPRFVDTLTAGADYAKGSRFAAGGGSDDITRVRRTGNSMLAGLVNLLFGTRFTDLCYGYNAIWVRCLETLDLDDLSTTPERAHRRCWGDGFEFETLVNVRAAVEGLRVSEVASFERRRLHGVSHLHVASDGPRVLWTILREHRRMRRRPLSAGSGRVGPRRQRMVTDGSPAQAGGRA